MWATLSRCPSFAARKAACPQPSRRLLRTPSTTMPICHLRRRGMLRPAEVSLIGRPPVEARMWPSAIVKFEIGADRSASLGHRVVSSEIHLFPFDRSPKPLDKDVVTP